MCALLTLGKHFDSVYHSAIWRIMKSYSIPEKIVKMVNVMQWE